MKASLAAGSQVALPWARYWVAATPLPPASAGLRWTVTALLCQARSASEATLGAWVSRLTKPVWGVSLLPAASTDQ